MRFVNLGALTITTQLLATIGCSVAGTSTNYAQDAGIDARPSGDSYPVAPQAIVDTAVAVGTGAACSEAGKVLGVGAFGDPQAGTSRVPVSSGASQDGHMVRVTCRVAIGANGGFDVKAAISADNFGAIAIASGIDRSGRSTTATITLSRADGSAWSSSACEIGPPSNSSEKIALGRFWATVRCAAAAPSGSASDACDITGEILVQDCAEE